MTKRKPCRVEIKQVSKEGTTGYIVSIDKPGPTVPYKLMDAEKPNKVKRYSAAWSAKRGALRNLKAERRWPKEVVKVKGRYRVRYGAPDWWIEDTIVKFVFTTSKRRK